MPKRKIREHVPPHRAWAYLYAYGELNAADHDHILQCESCLQIFTLCLKSDSFAAVLKELGDSNSECA